MNQIFLLKQVLASNYKYKLPTHMLFVDPEKLIRIIGMTFSQTPNAVRINGKISTEFEVWYDLRHYQHYCLI